MSRQLAFLLLGVTTSARAPTRETMASVVTGSSLPSSQQRPAIKQTSSTVLMLARPLNRYLLDVESYRAEVIRVRFLLASA